jgi:hypothetical protein
LYTLELSAIFYIPVGKSFCYDSVTGLSGVVYQNLSTFYGQEKCGEVESVV